MKREFNINDIAHLTNNKKLKGILHKGTDKESYKTLNLKLEDSVKIIGCHKADAKAGSYTYDCKVEYNGITYLVEYVAQFDLMPKAMWEKFSDMQDKLKEQGVIEG